MSRLENRAVFCWTRNRNYDILCSHYKTLSKKQSGIYEVLGRELAEEGKDLSPRASLVSVFTSVGLLEQSFNQRKSSLFTIICQNMETGAICIIGWTHLANCISLIILFSGGSFSTILQQLRKLSLRGPLQRRLMKYPQSKLYFSARYYQYLTDI